MKAVGETSLYLTLVASIDLHLTIRLEEHSPGLAYKSTGYQLGSVGPVNLATISVLPVLLAEFAKNCATPLLKSALVQFKTPPCTMNVVLMEPKVLDKANGMFGSSSVVER